MGRNAGSLGVPWWQWLAGITLTFAFGDAWGGEPPVIVLTERLGQTNRLELVGFPFGAKKGECAAGSIEVTGPGGPVPAQLSEVAYWPGKDARFVRSARLSFVVDEMPPRTSAVYEVRCGANAAPAPATDLKIQPASDSVDITTASIGVRLPLGDRAYDPPASLNAVPGPLVAARLGAGAWAGGSALTGTAAVAAWKAELTDAGPVLARAAITYTLADSNTVCFSATVIAGDTAIHWDMVVRDDRPDLGVEFRLPPVPGVTQAVLPKGYGQWARADRQVAVVPGGASFGALSPDSSLVNIFVEHPPKVRLTGADGLTLELRSEDPDAWSEPVAPLTYAGVKTWHLDSIGRMWDAWKRKAMPLRYAADGTVLLSASLAKGRRGWTLSAGAPRIGLQLDRVKDLVLDWPASPRKVHPGLFVGLPELRAAWDRSAADPALRRRLTSGGDWATAVVPVLLTPPTERKPEDVQRVVKPLRDQLALLGNFDVMRSAVRTVTLYDTLIASDLLSDQDRTLVRAQMAYLGYLLADPQCWSMERGYCSGNPNMSCSYTLSLGIIACALSDHPAAGAWAERATQWMDKWLTDEVGANGEWLPEGSHYGYVSLEPLVAYAIAAKRAGYHDFSRDPRLRKLLLYFAKLNTPRDVQRKGVRSIGSYGRGHGGCMAVFGCAAPFFRAADPGFASVMQWLWKESGAPVYMGDGRLGGLEPYYEEEGLPAPAPAWGSERFPGLGAVLRAGFDTPCESFVLNLAAVDSRRNLDIWTPEVGGVAQWYGRGQPLSTCFTFGMGYNERHELLRNGVRLARNWGQPGDPKGPFGHYTRTRFGAFAALPTADYVRSTFENDVPDTRDWFPDNLPPYPRVTPAAGTNLTWTRQLLFVKDPTPTGPAWLLLRDTTAGGQPTAWQFWTLSEKIGPPEQARDAVAFLADAPGRTNAPARELPAGSRYTALGQYGVDVEYLVAAPADTPRHTLRYGGPNGGNAQIPEYQDLLHLQRPGDGAYYVALFPRPRQEAAPTLTTLADGKLIKAAGAFGTDYALLATEPTEAAAEGVRVKGTVAAVQTRPDGIILSLGAAGEARLGEHALAAEGVASLRTGPDELLVTVPPSAQPQAVRLEAPGEWKVSGAKLERLKSGMMVLTVPAGTFSVRLSRN